MHNTNGKIVRAIANSDNRTLSINRELNGNNIILLRGAKSSDNGHILLRTTTTDGLSSGKTNLVCDAKLGQIFIQQSDLSEGVLLQSVKRLGTGTPILLLSGNDSTGNGHILIQTSSNEDARNTVEFADEHPATDNNILVQALEGLQDNESGSAKAISTPLGSGKFRKWQFVTGYLAVFQKQTLRRFFFFFLLSRAR